MKYVFLMMLSLIATQSAHAAGEVKGLICDLRTPSGEDAKMKIEISVEGKNAILSFRNPRKLNAIAEMQVAAKSVSGILKDDLAKMDGVTLSDSESELSLKFKVDGYTFDRKARLSALLSGPGDDMVMESCNVEIDQPMSAY